LVDNAVHVHISIVLWGCYYLVGIMFYVGVGGYSFSDVAGGVYKSLLNLCATNNVIVFFKHGIPTFMTYALLRKT
jgi:hypothetical protein